MHSSPASLALAIASQEPDQDPHQQDSDGSSSSQHTAQDHSSPRHRGKNRDNNRLLLRAELVVRLPLTHHDALGQDCGVPSVCVKGGVTCGTESAAGRLSCPAWGFQAAQAL